MFSNKRMLVPAALIRELSVSLRKIRSRYFCREIGQARIERDGNSVLAVRSGRAGCLGGAIAALEAVAGCG